MDYLIAVRTRSLFHIMQDERSADLQSRLRFCCVYKICVSWVISSRTPQLNNIFSLSEIFSTVNNNVLFSPKFHVIQCDFLVRKLLTQLRPGSINFLDPTDRPFFQWQKKTSRLSLLDIPRLSIDSQKLLLNANLELQIFQRKY